MTVTMTMTEKQDTKSVLETLLYTMSNACYIEFTFHVTNKGISQFE